MSMDMYIRGDHRIFEKMIFAKVKLNTFDFIKLFAERKLRLSLRFSTSGKIIVSASFIARDNLSSGREQAQREGQHPVNNKLRTIRDHVYRSCQLLCFSVS